MDNIQWYGTLHCTSNVHRAERCKSGQKSKESWTFMMNCWLDWGCVWKYVLTDKPYLHSILLCVDFKVWWYSWPSCSPQLRKLLWRIDNIQWYGTENGRLFWGDFHNEVWDGFVWYFCNIFVIWERKLPLFKGYFHKPWYCTVKATFGNLGGCENHWSRDLEFRRSPEI